MSKVIKAEIQMTRPSRMTGAETVWLVWQWDLEDGDYCWLLEGAYENRESAEEAAEGSSVPVLIAAVPLPAMAY